MGAVSNIKLPNYPGIIGEGVAEHSKLWSHVKTMDCLIMPF